MKKVLLFALSTFAVVSMNAQDCSSGIDYTSTELGFNPNPIVGSNNGTPYDEVVTIVIPKVFDTGSIQPTLKKIKIVTITPAEPDFFGAQGYAYDIWAKNLYTNNFEQIVVGGTVDTFAVDQNNALTFACLRLSNPTPPAPTIDPLIDTVHIDVEVDALIDLGITEVWASVLPANQGGGTIHFNVGFPKRAAGVSVNEIDATKFAIYGTFPNPASSETWVKFSTPNTGNASLKVYDITGKTVMNHIVPTVAGVNNVQLNISSLNAGIYLYSLTIGNETVTSKLIVQ